MSDAGNIPSSVAATAVDAPWVPDRVQPVVNGHPPKDKEDAVSNKADSEAETVIQSGRESISSEKKREYIKHEHRCSDDHYHDRDRREAPSAPAETSPPPNTRKRRRLEQDPLDTPKDRDRRRSSPQRRVPSPSWSSAAIKTERMDESRSGGDRREDGAWAGSRPSLQELNTHRGTRSSSEGIVDDPASRGGRIRLAHDYHPHHHHHHLLHHSPPPEDFCDQDRDRREPPNPTAPTSRSLSPPSRSHQRTISGPQLGMEEFPRRKTRPPDLTGQPRPSSEDRQSISSSASGSPMPSSQARKLAYSDWGTATSPAKHTTHKKQRDQNGRTRLARACAAQEVEAAIGRLAERPEDLNVADNAGNTPLQIAALEGCAPIVKILLDASCDVDTKNIDRDTPLIDAVENGHLDVVRLLLDAGANPRMVNAEGDEPYELVPTDSEDYDEIRRVLAEARSHPPLKRRSEEQSVPAHSSKDPSSRGASAASPHDSPPPAPGPRSPPPPGTISRRRTVRSEATRNDLLWTKATPENLREFAAKGDMAGVANILNVGQKADTESLIAAAKGGHDDVMQLLLGIGYADPDPLPLSGNHRDGYNTPMLATIGRGNLAVIRLLLAQPRFNPTRRFFKERTYYELSRERKGVQWEEEADLLKEAYDRARARKMRKPETKSPRRSRDKERERERDREREREREREKEVKRPVGRGSVSPPSQRKTVRSATSGRHHEPLPKDTAPSRGKVREESSAHQRERLTQTAPRPRVSNRDDHHSEPSVAASDVDGRFELPHRKPKVSPGRRQSDSGAAARGEDQVRRRRLIAGPRPPHDRDQRRPSLLSSDSLSGREEMSRARADRGSWDTQMVKQHPVVAPSSLKRSRSSLTPNRSRSGDRKPRREPEDLQKKKRRVLSEDHAQNIATGSAKKGHERRSPRARPRDHSVPDPGRVKSHQAATGVEKEQPARTRKPAEEPRVDVIVKEERRRNDGPRLDDIPMTAVDSREVVDHKKSEAEAMAVAAAAAAAAAQAQAEAVAAAAAAEVRRLAEEEAKKAEEDRIAEEKRAAAAAAEQARIAKEEKEREAKEAAEEAARLAREKAEEEERKRREAERRRRIRLVREQEEQERRRRNALPNRLRVAANLVGSNDPRARSQAWLKKFMPVVTAKTKQIDPACEPDLTDERWVPNYLVAPLLATNDLQLTQYPSWEKRNATPTQRNNLWRVTRRILVQADDSDFFGSSMGQVMQKDCETRPKYFDMEHVFWVRLSDFLDLVPHIPHLNGLEIDLLNMHIDGEPVIDHPIPESPQVNGHAFGFHHEESSTVMNGFVNGFGHARLGTYV